MNTSRPVSAIRLLATLALLLAAAAGVAGEDSRGAAKLPGTSAADVALQRDVANMIWFAATGIGLFLLYSLIRTGWGALKLVTKPFRWLFRRTKKKQS